MTKMGSFSDIDIKVRCSKSMPFWMKIIEFFMSVTCFALTTFYAESLSLALAPTDSARMWFVRINILAAASTASTFMILVPIIIGCCIHGSKVYDKNLAVILMTVGEFLAYLLGGIFILCAVVNNTDPGGLIATGVMYLCSALVFLFDAIMTPCCGLLK